jgi:hypothetical protein
MGMMKMNCIENNNRSISYFYHGGTVEEAGNNMDKIVSEVIGRIIMSNRNKAASPGDEGGAVM